MNADGVSGAGEPEPLEWTDVSVVVPCFRAGAHLRRCVESLVLCRPKPREIIVVFDGEEPDQSLTSDKRLSVLTVPSRGGPSLARNTGAIAARSRIVLFIDADITVPSDLIGRVEAAFETEDEPAAVFGSYDDTPGSANFLSQYKNLLHHFIHQNSRSEASTFFSACGGVLRDEFLAVGGFDERRRWMEDVELGYRLRDAGHRIRLERSLMVTHHKRWSVRLLLRSDILHRALPWAALLRQRGKIGDELNVTWNSRVSAVVVGALLVVLIASLWSWRALFALPFLVGALLALNSGLYRFFYRRRGLWFAVRAIPWHWFYFLYSSVAFVVGRTFYRAGWGRRNHFEPPLPG